MKSILVLGDSHALIFNSDKMIELFPDIAFNTVSVGGATVSGLKNPNAVTQAMPQYLAALEENKTKTTIIMLGEVDTGFVIWYRAQKHNAPVEQMYQQAITNYQRFMLEISKQRHVICISTPLPTIRDGTDWGEVANLRKEVKATLKERTELTIRFNKEVGAFCAKNKIIHCNFDKDSLDEHGILKESLRNPDQSDHHYAPSAHASMVAPKLRLAINEIEELPATDCIRTPATGLIKSAISRFKKYISLTSAKLDN